ncbi:hypothetical protein PR202_gb23016 [Eleusine coracana subsp. coracana]|uniref:Uncharacterized protein n=1 Tax=Eleusine coracana subsp. coracana TaxID=191504 RepID=A0AAV5FF66_ELECO|nr:hypothetical protein PR202_gb23016 [Eleusine coracana subsp. coracana]
MEATGVSLARSVLDGVVTSVRSAVADEIALLLGVPQEVEFIRSELEMMRSFLMVASAYPEAPETFRTWVKQVRDLGYDVEDCLLDFAHYAARTTSSSSSRAAGSFSFLPGAVAERHRIADRIRGLKATVEDLNQRNQRYRIAIDLPAARAEQKAAAMLPEDDMLAFQEADIIGRHSEKAKLTRLISRAEQPEPEPEHEPDQPEEEEQAVLPLPRRSWWSMSTLLWTSYWRINYYMAPRTGTTSPRPRPLPARPSSSSSSSSLRPVGSGDGALRVVSVYGMGGMGKSSLVRMVHNDPEFIDEFDIGPWITVPHPLDNPEVFRRRLRKELGLKHDQNMEEYLRDKRFRVVVDDLLSQDEWENVRKVLWVGNNKGSRIIVTTRREDVARHCAREGNVPEGRELIYELKALGDDESMDLLCRKVYKTATYTLPEDMAEQARHILSRCHGLPLAISTIGGLLANRPKTSIEWRNLHEHLGAVLESDLRNIPEVIVSSYDGLPYHLKSIFLYLSIFPENHEIRRTRLLRRWMAEGYIAKNRDMPVENVGERFYNELLNRSMIQPSKVIPGDVIADHCRVHSMVRHIIIYKSTEENQLFVIEKNSYEVPQSKIRHLVISMWTRRNEKLQGIDLSYVRSLTIFGEYPISLISPEMRLLRVLDLEDTVNLKNDDLKHIGELHHLSMDQFSLRAPEGIEKLKNLHMLGVVNVGNGNGVAGRLRKLTTLTNLQRLGVTVTGLTENEGNEMCTSIGELSRLQQLELRSDSLNFLGTLNESQVPKHLVSLRLCGNLTRLPEWIGSLNNLMKMELLKTRLEEGDITRLQDLRNLAFLGLWENSYIGVLLRFRTGTLPKLKFLDIDGLNTITRVEIMEGAMPELEQLWVNNCPSIHDDGSGLSGVPYLLDLNELLLKKCGDKEGLINILQGQVNRHKKRPKFLIGRSILLTNPMLPRSTTTE